MVIVALGMVAFGVLLVYQGWTTARGAIAKVDETIAGTVAAYAVLPAAVGGIIVGWLVPMLLGLLES